MRAGSILAFWARIQCWFLIFRSNMNNRIRTLLLAGAAFAALSPAGAQTVVVSGSGTPFTNPGGSNIADPACSAFADTWCARNVRVGGTVGQTTTYARSGNGSLYFTSNDINAKADFVYLFSAPNQFRVKDLVGMSYDYYRNGASTTSGVQIPALRLLIDPAFGGGELIYEPVYNGGVGGNNVWNTASINTGSFFWWNQDQNRFCSFGPDYSVTLADWGDGHTAVSACGGDRTMLDNAMVVGLSTGIGSGWNGMFDGAVDNISFQAGTRQATTFNFEVASQSVVPEPSSYALMFAGLAAVGFVARRRRNGQA